jgi:trimeric autotransporter adhesin
MNKHLISMLTAALFQLSVPAQNIFPSTGSAGIGTTAPVASSLLEVRSTTKGVLLPRMTTAQRNAIASPALGLFIFQTDGTKGFYYYDAGWKTVTPSISNFATRNLNNLTAPTAIGVDLLPGTTNTRNLGASNYSWKDLYLRGYIYLDGTRFLSNGAGVPTLNTFVGAYSGNSTTGTSNTATGHNSMFNNTTGANNTANGYAAAYTNTAGNYNTAIGSQALYSNSIGWDNTAVGFRALYATVGDFNTAVGFEAGLYGSVKGTFVGKGAYCYPGGLINATAIGYGAVTNYNNSVRIGNYEVTSIGGQVNWTAFSDGRFKKNIKDDVPGLEFITQLKPVTYNLDLQGLENTYAPHIREEKLKPTAEETALREANAKIKYTGFVAQEVEETAKKLGYDFSGIDKPKTKEGFYGLRYSDFVVPLVKAVQQLDADNKKLSEENRLVKEELAELRQMILELKQWNNSSNALKANLEGSIPNPASGTALIRYYVPQNSSSANIVFTDIKGAIMKSTTVNSKGSGQLTVNVATWSAGTYTYTLYINGQQADSRKLVITR